MADASFSPGIIAAFSRGNITSSGESGEAAVSQSKARSTIADKLNIITLAMQLPESVVKPLLSESATEEDFYAKLIGLAQATGQA